jgi:CheY-like chemotaxis protein
MKLRVLVFDDKESILVALKRYLEIHGHEVICAHEPTACKAFQGKVCNHGYPCGDILLTDNKMPNMTGLEFIEHMRNRGCKGLSQNKIVMSGFFSKDDIDKAYELGCHILNKPIIMEEIEELIEKIQKTILPDRKLIDLSYIIN